MAESRGGEDNIPQLGVRDSNANGDDPCSLTPAGTLPCGWRTDEFQKWTELPVQGRGIAGFKGCPVSNCWLRNHQGFTERCFIAALQVRANVYPTAEARCRVRPKTAASCALCSWRMESVSHILGQCPAMQSARIARHNKVCRLLAAEAEDLGWEVHREWPFVTASGELRRLDLVLTQDSEALAIDVTVRFEFRSDSLRDADKAKVRYYSPHTRLIAQTLGVRTLKFFGFPLGVRGLWYVANEQVLVALGMGRSRARAFARLMSRRVLLYLLDVLRTFAKACARKP